MKYKFWTQNINGMQDSLHVRRLLESQRNYEPDFICIQETLKDSDYCNGLLPGYYCHATQAPSICHGGMATYFLKHPEWIETRSLGFVSSGWRVHIIVYKKFAILNVYMPNVGGEHKMNSKEGRKKMNDKLMAFESLNAICSEFDKERIVLVMGDLNVGRYLHIAQKNKGGAGFYVLEKHALNQLKALGFVDAFDHKYPTAISRVEYFKQIDREWLSYKYILNYMLVSARAVNRIRRVELITDYQHESSREHMPMYMEIDL